MQDGVRELISELCTVQQVAYPPVDSWRFQE